MTSLQNLDCETQSVYFLQLPWRLDCGVEILRWQLSCGTLRTQPHCSPLPTWLSSLRGPRTLDQEAEREKWSDRPSSSLRLCCSVAQLCPTVCNSVHCSTPASLSFTLSRSLLRLRSIESVLPSSHLILWRPLPLLPSIFPSIRVFSNESALRSGGQSIGASASASVSPMHIQD